MAKPGGRYFPRGADIYINQDGTEEITPANTFDDYISHDATNLNAGAAMVHGANTTITWPWTCGILTVENKGAQTVEVLVYHGTLPNMRLKVAAGEWKSVPVCFDGVTLETAGDIVSGYIWISGVEQERRA